MAATATKTYIERLIENERNGGHDFTGGCQLLQYYTRETDEQALSRNASDELYVYEPCGTVGSVEIVTRGSLRRFFVPFAGRSLLASPSMAFSVHRQQTQRLKQSQALNSYFPTDTVFPQTRRIDRNIVLLVLFVFSSSWMFIQILNVECLFRRSNIQSRKNHARTKTPTNEQRTGATVVKRAARDATSESVRRNLLRRPSRILNRIGTP